MQIIYLLIIGFLSGIASSWFGIGGGIVIVPLCMLLLDQSQLQANGISLLALSVPIGAWLASYNYYHHGWLNKAHFYYGPILAIALALGAWVGSRFLIALNPIWLERGFGFLLIFFGLRMWFK